MQNRRQFLKNSALVTSSLLVPSFLTNLSCAPISRKNSNGKILVVVQLSGGNDGLNTIIPFRNDIYYNSRPKIAIHKQDTARISDDLGLHPALIPLRSIYEQGWMSIINSVGYPNPNRSHFRSMEIWQTASDASKYLSTGWLGRYLDAQCDKQGCGAIHNGIEVDGTLSLAMKGERQKALAVNQPRQLYKAVNHSFFKDIVHTANHHHDLHHDNDPLSYLYKTVVETISSAEYVHDKAKIYRSNEAYPKNKFGKHLKTIAELIVADIETSVFYVSLGGFDTHVNQINQQARLLNIYATAMKAFLQDLKYNNRLSDVLVMTFSEFGRRVAQNASNGTDHGTANNVFLMGENLKKAGFYNQAPDLSNLDNGELKYEIDFRSIYATVLKRWLKTSPSAILGKKFPLLNMV